MLLQYSWRPHVLFCVALLSLIGFLLHINITFLVLRAPKYTNVSKAHPEYSLPLQWCSLKSTIQGFDERDSGSWMLFAKNPGFQIWICLQHKERVDLLFPKKILGNASRPGTHGKISCGQLPQSRHCDVIVQKKLCHGSIQAAELWSRSNIGS